jgi:hypothetical protein
MANWQKVGQYILQAVINIYKGLIVWGGGGQILILGSLKDIVESAREM